MALSTLRFAARPFLVAQQSIIVARCFPPFHKYTTLEEYSGVRGLHSTAPMGTSAHDQMKNFWHKNLTLQRPNSPWWIYKPHLPMLTSLCHRMTGIAMGVAFYAFSIGVFLAPGDFPSYVEFIKNLEISPALLFPAKTIVAFPLVYHYINGIRHLTWDAGHGYELKTQYKTGWTIAASTVTISAILASIAYW